MKKIEVKTDQNGGPEKSVHSIAGLVLLSKNIMLFAGLIPPKKTIIELCQDGPKILELIGAGNRHSWNCFIPEEDDLTTCITHLNEGEELKPAHCPSNIDGIYKWFLWQHQFKFNTPYEEHKKLYDNYLLRKKAYRESILKNRSREVQMELFSLEIAASNDLDDFVNKYEFPGML